MCWAGSLSKPRLSFETLSFSNESYESDNLCVQFPKYISFKKFCSKNINIPLQPWGWHILIRFLSSEHSIEVTKRLGTDSCELLVPHHKASSSHAVQKQKNPFQTGESKAHFFLCFDANCQHGRACTFHIGYIISNSWNI